MSFIRTYPLEENINSALNAIGHVSNAHNVHAGRGIQLRHTSQGVEIHNSREYRKDSLTWQNIYDPTLEYFPDDVVVVPAWMSYVDYNSSPLTLTPQTYVCINYVPPATNTTAAFFQVVAAYNGSQLSNDQANYYRWYQFNNYYPFVLSGSTAPQPTRIGTYGAYSIVASQSFWQPIGGGGGSSAVPLWKTFDLSASYNVGDEVVVDPYRNPPYSLPLVIYPNTSSVPMLTPGAYMCQVAVPQLTLMSSSISSSVTSSRNSWNCWYPHYPVEPSSSLKTVSGSLANQVVWYPIAPASLELQCIDGGVTYQWNCGYISQSFNLAQLPYKGP